MYQCTGTHFGVYTGHPGGVQGYPRACLVNVVSLSPPECVLVYIRREFSCAQISLRNARERELATFNEN